MKQKSKIARWLQWLVQWLERDIERMRRISDHEWSQTRLGIAGVKRSSVGWWRRKKEIFLHAYNREKMRQRAAKDVRRGN
jgi:hypothetical protein